MVDDRWHFKGLSNDTTFMQIQSGRTIYFKSKPDTVTPAFLDQDPIFMMKNLKKIHREFLLFLWKKCNLSSQNSIKDQEKQSAFRENIRLLKIWDTDPGIHCPNGIHIQYPIWIWIRDTGLNRLWCCQFHSDLTCKTTLRFELYHMPCVLHSIAGEYILLDSYTQKCLYLICGISLQQCAEHMKSMSRRTEAILAYIL